MRSPHELVRSLLRPATIEADGLAEPASLRVRDIVARFWPDARPFRTWLALSLALVVVAPLLDTVTIWLFKRLIDDVLAVHHLSAFPSIAITYVAITVALGAVQFADDYLATWIGENFLHRLRIRVFSHLQTLSAHFFDCRPLGDTLSRLAGDVNAIENLMLTGVTQTAAQVIKIGLFAAVLCYLSWRLTIVSLVAVPLFWLITRFFSQRMKTTSRQVRRRTSSLSVIAEESLANATLIQVYGRQRAEITRFATASRSAVTAELAAIRLRAVFAALIDVLEVAGVMVIIGIGTWELTNHRITLWDCWCSWCTSPSSTARCAASGTCPTPSTPPPPAPNASSTCSTNNPKSARRPTQSGFLTATPPCASIG